MVDAADLKSASGDGVRVRVPLGAPGQFAIDNLQCTIRMYGKQYYPNQNLYFCY